MTKKDDTTPATKADIVEFRQMLVKRLETYDEQFEVVLKLLESVQDDVATIKRDLRILSDKVLGNYERRLMACERRLGLAV